MTKKKGLTTLNSLEGNSENRPHCYYLFPKLQKNSASSSIQHGGSAMVHTPPDKMLPQLRLKFYLHFNYNVGSLMITPNYEYMGIYI